MAEPIGAEHGAEAVRVRLNTIDPGRVAYDKFFGNTAPKLIAGHNENLSLSARVAALEDAVARGPFG